MIILLSLAALALAVIAGYVLGARRNQQAEPARETEPAPPPAPATNVAAVQTPPPVAADVFAAEKARIIRSVDAEAARLRQAVADAEAPLAQLSQFSSDRDRLYRELATTRAETARYRQLVIDIENNAPPPILSGSAGPDDLKLIVGVGPVLERMLHSLGIMTFRQIARWSERDVVEFDAKLVEFPGRIARDQWVTQARALHQSKYGERA